VSVDTFRLFKLHEKKYIRLCHGWGKRGAILANEPPEHAKAPFTPF
jgi:hypothetical protein